MFVKTFLKKKNKKVNFAKDLKGVGVGFLVFGFACEDFAYGLEFHVSRTYRW